MDQSKFDVEKQKSEFRSNMYRNLIATPEWEFFVKDMQTQIEGHKNACVDYNNQAQTHDAERQAAIITGILEALDHPKSIIAYHESYFNKVKTAACALCGRFSKIFAGSSSK